jgi:hypothetical protein
MSITDHWRTHPADFDEVARYFGFVGVPAVKGMRAPGAIDLDVASNPGSQILCRVALHPPLGYAPAIDPAVVLQTPHSVGGGAVMACGMSTPWPPELSVWCNGPFSSPAVWVARMVVHAWQGGKGCGLLPVNLLEGAWGQALMWLSGALRALFAQAPLSDAHAILAPLFTARGVPESLTTVYYDLVRSPPVGLFGLYVPSRRLGFIDTDGTPRNGNRFGTMIVVWGKPEYSGIHTAHLSKPDTDDSFPALEACYVE